MSLSLLLSEPQFVCFPVKMKLMKAALCVCDDKMRSRSERAQYLVRSQKDFGCLWTLGLSLLLKIKS